MINLKIRKMKIFKKKI